MDTLAAIIMGQRRWVVVTFLINSITALTNSVWIPSPKFCEGKNPNHKNCDPNDGSWDKYYFSYGEKGKKPYTLNKGKKAFGDECWSGTKYKECFAYYDVPCSTMYVQRALKSKTITLMYWISGALEVQERIGITIRNPKWSTCTKLWDIHLQDSFPF